MANLLDTIRQNSQTLPEQGVTDESQKLQTLLRAKSGKAVGGGPVASSNLAEQSAVAQTNQQMQQQVAPVAAIQSATQAQQSSDIQQGEQLQRAEVAQSRRFDDAQTRIRTEQVLRDLERNKGEVDEKTKNAQVEQVAATLRLQNKQYIDTLQREGELARLTDDGQFRRQAMQSALMGKAEILGKGKDTEAVLNSSDRDFQKQLAQMGVDDAWAIFKQDAAAAKQQAMWSGIGELGKAGIAAYGTATAPKAETSSSAGTPSAASKNMSNEADAPSSNIFASINRGK
jgi:hypothetical protein